MDSLLTRRELLDSLLTKWELLGSLSTKRELLNCFGAHPRGLCVYHLLLSNVENGVLEKLNISVYDHISTLLLHMPCHEVIWLYDLSLWGASGHSLRKDGHIVKRVKPKKTTPNKHILYMLESEARDLGWKTYKNHPSACNNVMAECSSDQSCFCQHATGLLTLELERFIMFIIPGWRAKSRGNLNHAGLVDIRNHPIYLTVQNWNWSLAIL